MMRYTQILWLYFAVLKLVLALKFSPVTREVGLRDAVGEIEAYADFNADKATDILVLNSLGVCVCVCVCVRASASLYTI